MIHGHELLHLDRTLELAAGGLAGAAPNPMVGAVVVLDSGVVAEGFHARYGGRHAEYEALEAAGERARGSTLYCNLEPCSYSSPGKHQPPCTAKIIDSEVRRVVIGQLDPNPRVSGRGVETLRKAGIEVCVLHEDDRFWQFNEIFNTRMSLSRPFVHLKCAMSLDGRIAAAGGDSKWITDDEARREAHRLRAGRDAVAVGIGTVLADDPLLSNRHFPGKNPRPVVFDSSLRMPVDSRLVDQRGGELLLLTAGPVGNDSEFRARKRRLESRGVTVLAVERTAEGRIDLSSALQCISLHAVHSLFVEGGGGLLNSFLREGLYDRFSAFIAPVLLGGGTAAAGDLGISRVSDAVAFESSSWRRIGDQQLFEAYRRGWQAEVKAGLRDTICGRKEEQCVYGVG